MAVWTCVNQEGYERFPFLYGTECTHKTVQTTTNTVKQIFVCFVTRVTQHNLLSFTYKKRNHILWKTDVRFLPQDNLLKFEPCFRCVKAFCIQVFRHRLKHTESTRWNLHCVLKEWLLRGQTADDLGYVCCSVDRHSNVHDNIIGETLHFLKKLNKWCVTQYRNLETKIVEFDAEK